MAAGPGRDEVAPKTEMPLEDDTCPERADSAISLSEDAR